MSTPRPDHDGKDKRKFQANRKKILASQSVCGVCGRPVDMSLKYPHPMSATVDHIIPVAKGGGSELGNLQLTHLWCNRQKSDRLLVPGATAAHTTPSGGSGVRGVRGGAGNASAPESNDTSCAFPLAIDWANYRSK